MRLTCRICTHTQHSTAQHTSTPHHITLAFDRQQHGTYTTSQHSRARRRSIGRHGARGAPVALGAVLPRAPNVPRHGQQDMKERTKGGPRLLSFIFSPSGCGDLKWELHWEAL